MVPCFYFYSSIQSDHFLLYPWEPIILLCISLNAYDNFISTYLLSYSNFKHWFFFHLPLLFFQDSRSLSERSDGRYSRYRFSRESLQQRQDDTTYRIPNFKVMSFVIHFQSITWVSFMFMATTF